MPCALQSRIGTSPGSAKLLAFSTAGQPRPRPVLEAKRQNGKLGLPVGKVGRGARVRNARPGHGSRDGLFQAPCRPAADRGVCREAGQPGTPPRSHRPANPRAHRGSSSPCCFRGRLPSLVCARRWLRATPPMTGVRPQVPSAGIKPRGPLPPQPDSGYLHLTSTLLRYRQPLVPLTLRTRTFISHSKAQHAPSLLSDSGRLDSLRAPIQTYLPCDLASHPSGDSPSPVPTADIYIDPPVLSLLRHLVAYSTTKQSHDPVPTQTQAQCISPRSPRSSPPWPLSLRPSVAATR